MLARFPQQRAQAATRLCCLCNAKASLSRSPLSTAIMWEKQPLRGLSKSSLITHNSTSQPADVFEKYGSKYEVFGESFLRALDSVMVLQTGKTLSPDQTRRIEDEVAKISQQLTSSDDPFPRTINIDFTANIVAPYRILKADGYPVARIKGLLEAAMESSTAQATEMIRQRLDGSKDAFSVLVDESKSKEAHFYIEPDFKHRRASESPESYHLEIRKCWYMNTLAKLDALEIGPVFCFFDKSWYGAIEPGRHAMRFTRPTTIADGYDRCRFNFDRVLVTTKPKNEMK